MIHPVHCATSGPQFSILGLINRVRDAVHDLSPDNMITTELDIKQIFVVSGDKSQTVVFPSEFADSLVPHLAANDCGGSFTKAALCTSSDISDAVFTSATKAELLPVIEKWLQQEKKEYQKDEDTFYLPRGPNLPTIGT